MQAVIPIVMTDSKVCRRRAAIKWTNNERKSLAKSPTDVASNCTDSDMGRVVHVNTKILMMK